MLVLERLIYSRKISIQRIYDDLRHLGYSECIGKFTFLGGSMLGMREIGEMGFNLIYLVFLYYLVIRMSLVKPLLDDPKKLLSNFRLGFLFLLIGDTGHVGFRIVAFLLGGLEANAFLVGLGSLATATTVTLLYMTLAFIWKIRFGKKDLLTSVLFWTMIVAGLVRFAIMAFPQNLWFQVSPPADWSLYRNLPLCVQGLVVAVLFLIGGIKEKDKTFVVFSICIFASYLFYMPILFLRFIPWIHYLMIPKTIAYLALAYYGYVVWFKKGVKKLN